MSFSFIVLFTTLLNGFRSFFFSIFFRTILFGNAEQAGLVSGMQIVFYQSVVLIFSMVQCATALNIEIIMYLLSKFPSPLGFAISLSVSSMELAPSNFGTDIYSG